MNRFPLLNWGLFFALGIATALKPHWVYLVPFIGLLYLSHRKGQSLLFLSLGLIYCLLLHPPIPSEELQGRGIFQLEKIQPIASPFQRSYAMKGTLLTWASENREFSHLPCTVMQPKIPPKGKRFLVQGVYKEGVLKIDKKIPWQVLGKQNSWAHSRFAWKERVREKLKSKLPNSPARSFFSAIATGDNDDRFLAMEFRKVGLGHILAISGFHFALVAGMLFFLLKAVAPEKIAYTLLFSSLLMFYVYLGFSPSILRAFIMIILFFTGTVLRRMPNAINLLGAALLVELIQNPRVIADVGFQLTFIATLGILLFYRPMHEILERILPSRSYLEVIKMGKWDQHGYFVVNAIRKATALNLAVHFTTIPVCLFVFGSFPLLSFAYNIVLPPFLAASMILLPFGLLFPPLLRLNCLFTDFTIRMIGNPPEILHHVVYGQNLSFSAVIVILTIAIVCGLTKREETG